MKDLVEFDRAMRKFSDFSILDIHPSSLSYKPMVYRLGSSGGSHQEMILLNNHIPRTPEILADAGLSCPEIPCNNRIAPWRRLILCQGLSLVKKVLQHNSSLLHIENLDSLPYLSFWGDEHPIKIAAELHLSCKRMVGSKLANPYIDLRRGFHITFYEAVENGRDLQIYEEWKTGNLYKRPSASESIGDVFRQSAFTMLATAKDLRKVNKPTPLPENPDEYWTILLLSPSGFFPKLILKDAESNIYWMATEKLQNMQIAELAFVVDALREVWKRWAVLNDHMAELLSEDFMDPKTYVKLLFDDETFTRSRRYFWVIGCLNEFDVSISDNIKQWELFQQARVVPYLEKTPPAISPSLEETKEHVKCLSEEADSIREGMEDLRSQFHTKLATVRALRDGLFSASALVESRASTRLGQNVMLLTYVSIFYLPLAFCAALWAIPDIAEGATRNAFIITAITVGLVTYIIVFNLVNVMRFLGRKYHNQRTKLVEEMQYDSRSWKEKGGKFEAFRPNNDRKTPSEWWLIVYQIRTFFWKKKHKGNSESHLENA